MWTAWLDGMQRVNRAPALLAAAWLIAACLAWPIAMSSRIEGALVVAGASRDRSAAGERWLDALREQTLDGSVTVGGGIAGLAREPGTFVDYLSRWMVALTAAYPFLALWMVLSGGVIDRLARDRPVGAHGVGAATGAFFFPFLRLGIVIALAYGAAFRWLGQWPAALLTVLAAVNLVADYAQVRMVVEDRRSMLGALRASLGFIRRNPLAVVGLYAADYALLAVVTGLYVLLGPGAGFRFGPASPVEWTIALWVLINQLCVVGRLWVRMVFWASAAALFQGRLAHAGYVRRALPVWPDSPTVEALRRLP